MTERIPAREFILLTLVAGLFWLACWLNYLVERWRARA